MDKKTYQVIFAALESQYIENYGGKALDVLKAAAQLYVQMVLEDNIDPVSLDMQYELGNLNLVVPKYAKDWNEPWINCKDVVYGTPIVEGGIIFYDAEMRPDGCP